MPKDRRLHAPPMTIIQDTREQRPYDFKLCDPAPLVKVATLNAGDYSIEGLEDRVAIERKSLVDAFGTFGAGRERFERELERLASYRYALVVLEREWSAVFHRPPARSKLPPKVIHRSVIAWEIRYGVHFRLCPDREFAERSTYLSLLKFWDYWHQGIVNENKDDAPF
jgi:DNA excision repair protein ERCC-4